MAKNDRARRKRQRSEQTDLLERIKKWSRENRTDGPSGTEVLERPQPPSPRATTIEAAKRSSRAFREALDSAWLPDMTGNPIDPRDPSVQAIDALREEIRELLTDERTTDEGPSQTIEPTPRTIIDKYRFDKGIKVEALMYEKIGISKTTYYNVKHQHRWARPQAYKDMADYFECQPSDLHPKFPRGTENKPKAD